MASAELKRAREWEQAFAEANAAAGGLEEVREVNDKWQAERAGELPTDLVYESVDIGGIPGEWIYIEGAKETPTVLFVHGGGFMLGSARENREWVGRLMRSLGGRALAVDYRLAPEHPYPTQVEDVHAAYRWLLEQGGDPNKIAIVGESAGGSVATAALVAIRKAGDPNPAAAALLSPLVDFTISGKTFENNNDPFVGREVIQMMLDTALQGKDPKESSPLYADLTGIPPVLIQAGTAEALYDDSLRLAEAAAAVGVDVTLEKWEDMIHLWHGFPYLPDAREAVERVAEYLGGHLGERQ